MNHILMEVILGIKGMINSSIQGARGVLGLPTDNHANSHFHHSSYIGEK